MTFGAEALRDRYTTDDLTPYDPLSAAQFVEKKVPRSDTRVGPFAQVRFYKTDYFRVIDVDTFSLQEDFRLGHDILFKVYPVFSALGSTRTFLGLDARAQQFVARLLAPLADVRPSRVGWGSDCHRSAAADQPSADVPHERVRGDRESERK